MMNGWLSLLLALVPYVLLGVTEGVLIEEGHEQAEFTQRDSESIQVRLLCPGKYTTVNDSPYVILRWYDITNPGQKDLIVTIHNSSDVSIGPDFRGKAEVTRLSSGRLNGSIELTLQVTETIPFQVFSCEVLAINDQPSFYSRPVFARNAVVDHICTPSTPGGQNLAENEVTVKRTTTFSSQENGRTRQDRYEWQETRRLQIGPDGQTSYNPPEN